MQTNQQLRDTQTNFKRAIEAKHGAVRELTHAEIDDVAGGITVNVTDFAEIGPSSPTSSS